MYFCAIQYNSNKIKASYIWKNITNILEAIKKDEELCIIQMRQFRVCPKVLIKAIVERSRKWAHWDWITWLYVVLCNKFN